MKYYPKYFLWCLNCERVFSNLEWRKHENLCPSCNTDAFLNAWEWKAAFKDFRLINGYPKIPIEGKIYPMYLGTDLKAAIPNYGSMAQALEKSLKSMNNKGLFNE